MIYFDKTVTAPDCGKMAPWVACHAIRQAQLIRGRNSLMSPSMECRGCRVTGIRGSPRIRFGSLIDHRPRRDDRQSDLDSTLGAHPSMLDYRSIVSTCVNGVGA